MRFSTKSASIDCDHPRSADNSLTRRCALVLTDDLSIRHISLLKNCCKFEFLCQTQIVVALPLVPLDCLEKAFFHLYA